MRKAPVVVALFAAAALATPPVGADFQGRGRGKPPKGEKAEKKQDAVVIDRDEHRRVIREYRTAGLPPGLAKRESLPPGLRKQLRERGELPPGLQKRLVAVPRSLESRLPRIPRHYERHFAGDDLIVVDTRTNTIVAIVPDVLR